MLPIFLKYLRLKIWNNHRIILIEFGMLNYFYLYKVKMELK